MFVHLLTTFVPLDQQKTVYLANKTARTCMKYGIINCSISRTRSSWLTFQLNVPKPTNPVRKHKRRLFRCTSKFFAASRKPHGRQPKTFDSK